MPKPHNWFCVHIRNNFKTYKEIEPNQFSRKSMFSSQFSWKIVRNGGHDNYRSLNARTAQSFISSIIYKLRAHFGSMSTLSTSIGRTKGFGICVLNLIPTLYGAQQSSIQPFLRRILFVHQRCSSDSLVSARPGRRSNHATPRRKYKNPSCLS